MAKPAKPIRHSWLWRGPGKRGVECRKCGMVRVLEDPAVSGRFIYTLGGKPVKVPQRFTPPCLPYVLAGEAQ